jgi:hypothetical protein
VSTAAMPLQQPELSPSEAVEQLAQALLREYMHRKGAKATLAIFDEENPRTEKTIGSRAVMTSLMHMEAIQARNKRRPQPLATFMEQLCGYRLRKRSISKQSTHRDELDSDEDATMRVPSAPPRDDVANATSRRDALHHRLQEVTRAREAALAAVSAATPAGTKVKREKKTKEHTTDTGEPGHKAEKKSKKSKKLSADDNPSGSRGNFDPLGLAGSTVNVNTNDLELSSSLLAAGRRGSWSAPSGSAVGQKWNPGSGSNVPEVGLGAGAGAVGTGAGDEGPRAPPKYLAGAGMELMGTRVRAAASRDDVRHFADSPPKRKSSFTAAVDDEPQTPEDTLLPPDYFQSKYNPAAKGQPVLKKTSPPGPQAASPASVSSEPKDKRRVRIMLAEDP